MQLVTTSRLQEKAKEMSGNENADEKECLPGSLVVSPYLTYYLGTRDLTGKLPLLFRPLSLSYSLIFSRPEAMV